MSTILLPKDATRTAAEARREARRSVGAYLRRVDWLLVAAIAGVAALSVDVIGSSTAGDVPGHPHYYLDRQELYFAVGGAGMLVATFVRPGLWRRLHWPLAIGTALLIAMVLAVGTSSRGGTRWISLPFLQFQPSELGKLVLVLGLAGFLADRRHAIGSWRITLVALVYAGIAAGLVFLEPDLGTALVYSFAALAVLFVAGTRWTHFAALAVIGLAGGIVLFSVLPSAGVQVFKPYQTDRLTQFLHPHDLSGTGWNQNQARIAVGSGGIDGLGAARASQTNGDFLPEHHTDFVFATLAEQRGFVGAALLLGLYLLILWRTLRAVALAETLFGSLVAAGVAAWLLFSIFVNVGMTIGLAPVTGIPLPLMSFGGSSILVTLFALGIVQAVQVYGRLGLDEPEGRRYEERRQSAARSIA